MITSKPRTTPEGGRSLEARLAEQTLALQTAQDDIVMLTEALESTKEERDNLQTTLEAEQQKNDEFEDQIADITGTVGKLDYFLISVAPHGASEMTGAIISGGAGFVMAWALIAPGRRTRGQALKAAGTDAFRLMMLSIVMMFIAAPFEGYFSFNPNIPVFGKIAVAVIMSTFWGLYFFGYGRNYEPPSA